MIEKWDSILFGSGSGDALIVHGWKLANPSFNGLAGNGWTGFELIDAVNVWRASAARVDYEAAWRGYRAARPHASFEDLRQFRRDWWVRNGP